MMKVDLILLRRIHDAISAKSTGAPEHFSERLGVSLRTFHETREFMRNELSAPIVYCRSRQTYYYAHEWELYIGDLHRIKAELIKGVMQAINHTVKILFFIVIVGV